MCVLDVYKSRSLLYRRELNSKILVSAPRIRAVAVTYTHCLEQALPSYLSTPSYSKKHTMHFQHRSHEVQSLQFRFYTESCGNIKNAHSSSIRQGLEGGENSCLRGATIISCFYHGLFESATREGHLIHSSVSPLFLQSYKSPFPGQNRLSWAVDARSVC